MRAHAPRRPKFRPSGEENKQRCPRTSFGKAAQKVKRGRIGPMEVFHHYHRWLSPCASHPPIGKRRQLPASQFLRRQSQCAVRRQWNVEQRSQEGGVLQRVKLDQRQRVLQVRQALLGGRIGTAETLTAPISDWV